MARTADTRLGSVALGHPMHAALVVENADRLGVAFDDGDDRGRTDARDLDAVLQADEVIGEALVKFDEVHQLSSSGICEMNATAMSQSSTQPSSTSSVKNWAPHHRHRWCSTRPSLPRKESEKPLMLPQCGQIRSSFTGSPP